MAKNRKSPNDILQFPHFRSSQLIFGLIAPKPLIDKTFPFLLLIIIYRAADNEQKSETPHFICGFFFFFLCLSLSSYVRLITTPTSSVNDFTVVRVAISHSVRLVLTHQSLFTDLSSAYVEIQ